MLKAKYSEIMSDLSELQQHRGKVVRRDGILEGQHSLGRGHSRSTTRTQSVYRVVSRSI